MHPIRNHPPIQLNPQCNRFYGCLRVKSILLGKSPYDHEISHQIWGRTSPKQPENQFHFIGLLARQFRDNLIKSLTTSWLKGLFENKIRPIGCSKESSPQYLDYSASSERFMRQTWAIILSQVSNQTSEVNLKHYINEFWAIWKICVEIHPLNRCNGKAMGWDWYSGCFDEVLHQFWWDIPWP